MDSADKSNKLLPKLGLFITIAIVTGAVIGSGIFKKPASMAEQLGSPELMILIWVVAGIITLFGALSNAEVASMITKTGGQYVFFRTMYGEFTGFLYGWAIFAVIQTGSIASITYVFAEYAEYFWLLPRFSPDIEQNVMLHIPYIGNIYPLQNIGVKLLTITVIMFLSTVNYFGVIFGGRISGVFTTLKVAAIGIIIVLGFAIGNGSFGHLTQDSAAIVDSADYTIFAAVIMALAGAFWAYDGWNNITYIAGEVKQPQRNIPKALFVGTCIVIVTYILLNLTFLYIMPVEEMAGSRLVASDVAQKFLGPLGGGLIAALVMVSTFGTSNGTIMVSSRVYYAMAKDGLFFKSIGKTHDKYKTPANSLMLQGLWASMLVMSGKFDDLTDMLIFVSWIFYMMGAFGVFVLRKKMPDAPRPYKVWGYPFVPAIFVIFALAYVVFTLYNDIDSYSKGNSELINSLFGLLLVAAGLPWYFFFKARSKKLSKQ
jgi:basic amino acid/polyamine antiporter, APA family